MHTTTARHEAALALLALCCTFTAACGPLARLAGTAQPADLAATVTITRDEWGVPAIHAPTAAGAAFGIGYAQAEDSYRQLEDEYLRLAVHADGGAAPLEQQARAEYAREPAQTRALWDAYVAGVNHWVQRSDTQPRGLVFEPWMVLARAAATEILANDSAAAMWIARRETGPALVYSAPYAPIGESHHEVLVQTDDGWHVRGYALLGTPVPHTGHNGSLAWTAAGAADAQTLTGRLQQWYRIGRSASVAEVQAGGDVSRVAGVVDAAGAAVGAVGVLPMRADSAWTLDALQTAAFMQRVARHDEEVRALVRQWEEVGGANPMRASQLDEALDLLRAWDGVAAAGSAATTLYVLWQERLRTGASPATGEYARFSAMADVVAQLRQDWQRVTVEWGEIQRLQRLQLGQSYDDERASVPAPGVPPWTGATFVLESERGPWARRYVVRARPFVMVTELGDVVSGRSVSVFGNAADAASPHWQDQSALYVRGGMKPAWFTRNDVLANARRTYRP